MAARRSYRSSRLPGLFAQPLYISHGRSPKIPFVLPVEVGGIIVPHSVGRTGRVEIFPQHQTAGLLESQLFLELQRTHGRNRLKVMMKAGDAHAQLVGNGFNPKRLVKVVAQAIDRLPNPIQLKT